MARLEDLCLKLTLHGNREFHQVENVPVSIVMLEEYVDANGGFEQVDKGKKWAGISMEMGLGSGSGDAVRTMYLDHLRSQNGFYPMNGDNTKQTVRPPTLLDRKKGTNVNPTRSPDKQIKGRVSSSKHAQASEFR